MTFVNPPNGPGVMHLTDEERAAITEKLQVIIEGFTPTINQPEIDTQYITAKYNQQNAGNEINGDTVDDLLGTKKEGE
jgi:hypothetical protein